MKTISACARCLCLLTLAQCCLLRAVCAEAGGLVPAIVQKGFDLFKSGGPTAAASAWKEGGLLEQDAKAAEENAKFKEMVKPLRNYRSFEILEVKEIGTASRILFVAISFERGVLYGSFLVCKPADNWVVQHMNFNTKPEVIMPWLLLGGAK